MFVLPSVLGTYRVLRITFEEIETSASIASGSLAYQDDLVVCLLRGGFTRVQQTLLDGGRGHAVIQQRMEFQEVMRDRFIEVVAHATGREVIGFMSGNQQQHDMVCEVFVLKPSDLITDDDPRATDSVS